MGESPESTGLRYSPVSGKVRRVKCVKSVKSEQGREVR